MEEAASDINPILNALNIGDAAIDNDDQVTPNTIDETILSSVL